MENENTNENKLNFNQIALYALGLFVIVMLANLAGIMLAQKLS